jgi:hypothetical protein
LLLRFRAALSSLAEPCDVPVLVRNKDRQSRLYGRQQVRKRKRRRRRRRRGGKIRVNIVRAPPSVSCDIL